jgi:hypothetical protein
MAQDADAAECVAVAVVFRHGARGLVRSSADGLRSHAPAGAEPGAHACASWSADDMEHITTVGTEQMRQLGRWLGLKYLPRTAGSPDRLAREFLAVPPKWRSSIVPRVVESGHAVLEGLRETLPPGSPLPTAPAPYACDDEADFVYRNWHRDADYMAATRALRTSEGMVSAALKARRELEGLYGALCGVVQAEAAAVAAAASAASSSPSLSAAAADAVAAEMEGATVTLDGLAAADGDAIADALDRDPDEQALARQLYQATYVKELWDCEAHWPATATALRNGLIAPGDCSASSSADTVNACTPGGVKAALLRRLGRDGEAFMRRAARWVWEQRFLASPITAKPFAGAMGGAVVAEILGDLAAAAAAAAASSGGAPPPPRVALYSAHDYTLLSILGALKVAKHPGGGSGSSSDGCIGFGSFMVVEAWRPAAAGHASRTGVRGAHPGVWVTVRFLPDPFPRARDGYPTDLVTSDLAPVVDGASLDGLLALADRWPKWTPQAPRA